MNYDNRFLELAKEIDEIADNKLLAFQILLPQISTIDNSIHIKTLIKSDKHEYDKCINRFLHDDFFKENPFTDYDSVKDTLENKVPDKSLYHLRFDKPYEIIPHSNISQTETETTFFKILSKTVPVDKIEKYHNQTKESNLEIWAKAFDNFGKSTLWSYIEYEDNANLDNELKNPYSYYFVFDKILKNGEKKVNEINKIIQKFLISYVFRLYKNELRIHSIKSAKAAIMARNISHNLGSHVIYYIKSAIQSFEDIDTYPHLAEFNKKGDDIILPKSILELKKEIEDITDEEREIKAPFLRGLIRFLNYLQERHDYIATISNNHIPYSGSVNFKDVVFDIIIPDRKIERHRQNEYINYKEQNLLLDFIAKSEKLNRNSIEIFYKTFGKTGKFIPSQREGSSNSENNSDEHLKDLRDIEINLPSGIMGRQAFFSIFENFIRNTAKHSQNKQDKELKIVFCIKKENDFYQFMLYDANNITTRTDFEDKISVAIKDEYTKEDGELNQANKGIKEMRISAAWLRGLQVENIKNEQNLENDGGKLLEVNLVDPATFGEPREELKGETILNQGALCYKFKVPISKKMVVITLKKLSVDNDNTKFEVVTPEDYLNDNFIKNYKLTVIDDELQNIDSTTFTKLINRTPARTLKTNLKDLKTINKIVFIKFYKRWINSFVKFNTRNLKDFVILIEDKEILKNEEKSFWNIVKSTSFTSEDWNKFLDIPSIIFRTHNDTEERFKTFKEENMKFFNQTSFLEGISGHNSTERLIRHDQLNEEWYLKMLESALTKITIIDERIYDNYKTNSAERKQTSFNELNIHTESVNDFEKFIEDHYPDYIMVKKEKYYNKIIDCIESKIKYQDNRYTEILHGYLEKAVLELNKSPKNNINHSILGKKNISIYNLEKINSSQLLLLNLNQNHRIINFDYKIEKSHFVLVHQGILEKLKSNEDANLDDTLNKFKTLFPVYNNGKYIVHSGRSLPNELPLDVGFAQFSSVEAALNDCKFSLSELTFNSIVERPST